MFKKLILFFVLGGFFKMTTAQHNVILIIADDLGTDYLGFYENHLDTVAVPNIRRLLPSGVRFSRAWANPLCSPTRAGILTGRYSFRTGVGTAVKSGTAQLDTSELTIPRLLNLVSSQHVSSANIGKWHLHHAIPQSNILFPNLMGYDHYEGLFTGALNDYYNWTKTTNGNNFTVSNYATTEITNNAISWITSHQSNPFFLWLAYTAPHTPYHLPPAGMYADHTLTGTPAHIAANKKAYYKAMVEALDFQIGRLLDTLHALQLTQTTDIIFIGDNGDDQQIVQTVGSGRAKGSLYQAGICVPMIISGPSVVNPGRSSPALTSTHDLFATIFDLYGFSNWKNYTTAYATIDSRSLMPVVLNQADSIRPWVFTEVFGASSTGDGKTMRNDQYKLIDFDSSSQKLYFLPADSNEISDRLITTMTATDSANYYYLCHEMANLTGINRYCDFLGTNDVQTEDSTTQISFVYPNPFTTFIKLSNEEDNDSYLLINSSGKKIYEGKDIIKQNFHTLSNGIYFLKTIGNNCQTFKLLKR